MDPSLKGKTAIVTGGTSGIGLATARGLARLGAQVTLISRDPEKCARTAEMLTAETGSQVAPVEWIAADLSSLEGIRSAAIQFKQGHPRPHILVNNAGVFNFTRRLSVDGLEMTFALNHMGYFLLTNLLLDLLKASAPARVICVSSGLHVSVKSLDLSDLQGQHHFRGTQAYARSKLENLLFTYELSRRLEGSRVTANAVHPGYVNTNLGAENGPAGIFAKWSARWFGRAVEEGARTSIYLAASPEVEGVTGKYFADCKEVPSSPLSYDTALAGKLWQVSLDLAAPVLPPARA